jgi:hypothetical protein
MVALLTLALAAVNRMRPGVIAPGETRRVCLWRSMLKIGESGVFFCLYSVVIGANTIAYRFQFFGINGEMNGIGMDSIS